MSWVAAVVGTTFGLSKLAGGLSAVGNKGAVRQYKRAALDIYKEREGLLGERKELDLKTLEGQYQAGMRDLSLGTQQGYAQISGFESEAYRKGGMSTMGSVDTSIQLAGGTLMDQYSSDTKKYMDSLSAGRTTADIAYRTGIAGAEEDYQNKLNQVAGTPDTFWKGVLQA